LLYATLFLAAGVWFGLQWPGWLIPAAVGLGVSFAGALLASIRAGPRSCGPERKTLDPFASIMIALAFLLAGWVSAGLQADRGFRVSGIDVLPTRLAEVTLVGVVDGDPEPVTDADGRVKAWRFAVDAERVFVGAEDHVAQGTITVFGYVAGTRMPPEYGERWECAGTIVVSARTGRSALQGSLYGFRKLSGGHGSAWRAMCFRARRGAGELLEKGIGHTPMVAAILRALMLGYRSELDPALRDIFVATGTLHIFAISGSHVVVMAGMILFVARLFRMPRTRWVLVLAPVLTIYTAGTGAAASAVRAALMAIVFWAGGMMGRRPDTLSAVALSAMLILVVAPAQLVDLGFILSFAVVIGLIFLQPAIAQRLRVLWEPDPWRIQAEKRWVQVARAVGEEAAGLVSLSIAAWLVSAPLTACFFSRFTPIGLISNLLVVPLSFLVMVAGCLSIAAGVWSPWLAVVFNSANVVLVNGMVWLTAVLSKIPGGNMEVEPWSAVAVVCWYVVLAGWVIRERERAVEQARSAAKPASEQARAGLVE
jgi:ComEC/Rec2-related protein